MRLMTLWPEFLLVRFGLAKAGWSKTGSLRYLVVGAKSVGDVAMP